MTKLTDEELAQLIEDNGAGWGGAKAAERLRELSEENGMCKADVRNDNLFRMKAERDELLEMVETQSESVQDAQAVERLLEQAGHEWTDLPKNIADLLAERDRYREELSEQREKYVEACKIADGYRKAVQQIRLETEALAQPVTIINICQTALSGEGER